MSSVADETTYCAVHPDRETALQCNKCGRFMCVQCAVQSPVGYRCRECARGIEDTFFTANPYDPWIIFGVCAGLNVIGAFAAWWTGAFLLLIVIAAFPIGGLISEVALRLVQKRRGRQSARMAAAGAIVGGLIPMLFHVLSIGVFIPQFYITLFVYAGLTAAAVYGRFQMRV